LGWDRLERAREADDADPLPGGKGLDQPWSEDRLPVGLPYEIRTEHHGTLEVLRRLLEVLAESKFPLAGGNHVVAEVLECLEHGAGLEPVEWAVT
jgi:hypothetical protein